MTTTAHAPRTRPENSTPESVLDRQATRSVAGDGPSAAQLDALLGSVGTRYGVHHVGPDGQPAGGGATAASHAAGPAQIDFGDVELDCDRPMGCRQIKQSFAVSNLDPAYEAYPTVTYQGDPEIQIIAKPTRLRPSHEQHNPAEDIKLVYSPTARGISRGVVTIALTWQASSRTEEVHVPVIARAHRPGEPTHAEQAAAEAAKAQATTAEAADAERKAEVEAWIDEHDKEHSHRLDKATALAGNAADFLARQQARGAEDAEREVAKFKRRKPPHAESFLWELAMFAVDVATAGIAAAVAKTLEKKLATLVIAEGVEMNTSGGFERWRTGPQKILSAGQKAPTGFFVDSVKQAIKGGGKEARDALAKPGASESAVNDGASTDAQIEFFSAQQTRLATEALIRKGRIEDVKDELLPLASVDKRAAVAAMEDVETSLKAEGNLAVNLQADEAVRQWTRFLAQKELGANDDATVTKVEAANGAPSEGREPTHVDGLVDIGFTADFDAPDQLVQVQKATIRGVSDEAAARLTRDPLIGQGIPVRAFGMPSSGVAVLPITVVRNERGGVSFTDDTGAPGVAARWLSRKAGKTGHAQAEGARKLIEEEIMSKSLSEHGVTLETDDDPTEG